MLLITHGSSLNNQPRLIISFTNELRQVVDSRKYNKQEAAVRRIENWRQEVKKREKAAKINSGDNVFYL